MADKRRVAMVLTEEALTVLDRYSSERKRGAFVSMVLVEYEARQNETKRTGLLERMDRRLESGEKMLKERQP